MFPSKKNYYYQPAPLISSKNKSVTRALNLCELNPSSKNTHRLDNSFINRISLPSQNQMVRLESYRKKQQESFDSAIINFQGHTKKSKGDARNSDLLEKENFGGFQKLNTRRNKLNVFSDRKQDKMIEAIFRNHRLLVNQKKRTQKFKEQHKIGAKQQIFTKSKRNKTEKNEASLPNKLAFTKSKNKNQQNLQFCSYQTASRIGSKPNNQDSIKCGQNIWILCDGHGENGHEVSKLISEILFQLVHEARALKSLSYKRISQIFAEAEEILQTTYIDITLSGSTCTLLVKDQEKIYIANIGDSPALAITNSKLKYKTLFMQHKPSLTQQRKRIQFYGGSVRKHPLKTSIKDSPDRLWGTKEDDWGPGLAVSRSFGDKMAQKYGLICQPSIYQIENNGYFSHLIVGSDGLFDKISFEQLIAIIQQDQERVKFPEENLCQKIVGIARNRWCSYSDDVSAILIYL